MNLYKYADRAVVLFVQSTIVVHAMSCSGRLKTTYSAEVIRVYLSCKSTGEMEGTCSKEMPSFPSSVQRTHVVVVTNIRSPSVREEHCPYAAFSETSKRGFIHQG
ncbi:hypothetical protein EDC04DRAFT_2710918 [Pisolithus marmoratus]|nr:hypothetical protein EDC04DRAFT_2710918 [Pisolithus marmoratus]